MCPHGAQTAEQPSEVRRGRTPWLSSSTSRNFLKNKKADSSRKSSSFCRTRQLSWERAGGHDGERVSAAHHPSNGPPSTMFFYSRQSARSVCDLLLHFKFT